MGRSALATAGTPHYWLWVWRRQCVLVFIAAGTFVATLSTATSAQVRNFTNYTAAEGLPQAQVLSISQDRAGYLWFATYGGLSRFNGAEFRTWTTEDGLTSNSIWDVTEAAPGRLLIATSAGVCVMEREQFHCYRESDGLANDNARSVAADGAGGMWVGTARGVSHITSAGIRTYGLADGLPAERIIRVVVDSAGGVWAATDRGLSRLEGDRFVADSPETLDGRAIQFIVPVGRGLLIGSEGRLYLRGDDGLLPVAAESIPSNTQLVDGAIDADGTIWVATRDGVLRVSDGNVVRLRREHGLLSNLVNRVELDSEGDVWFGTDSGASKHVPGPFSTYTVNEGLPNSFVRAIDVDVGGTVWVGTRNGIAVLENDRFRPVQLPGLADARVYGLSRTRDGGMLIGLPGGLGYLKEGRLRLYTSDDGLPGTVVYALLPDASGGGVWVATDRGLARWEDGRLSVIDQPDLNELSIISLAVDDRGRLWLGRIVGGVSIWDGRTLASLGPENGLSEQTVWSLAMDAQGNMWVGTNGDGAFRVGSDGIDRFTEKDGLASDFIWQVLPDSRGDVWLFGNDGLDKLTGNQLMHYGRGSGLIELEGSAGAAREDANGDLLFGTGMGLVRYVPGLDVAPQMPPPVYIESVTFDGEPIAVPQSAMMAAAGASGSGSAVRLEHGEVRIVFGSPSFRDESAIRYRYRLIGGGSSWSAPTRERTITYAGLAPRRYRFEVVAENRGLGSEAPAVFPFTITPAFWQTWWFRIVTLLLLAAVPWLRARWLEKERRRLERLVAHHTRELAEKNTRLEHSNRDLEHFAYVASHDLQEPLRKIRAFSDRVRLRYADLLDERGRDYLARTDNAAARMQQLIDDLLSLSRVTTRQNPMRRIDLGALVHDVISDLEIRLHSTEGRVEVGDLPQITADPGQIRQLMQNLIGNALKFHRPDVPPVVKVGARHVGPGMLEIWVEDNGIGFESDDAEKVFLPFHRLHGRVKYEGTGIGLSICQKIVDRHGGTIRAHSKPASGSRFVVTLPHYELPGEAHAA